MNHVIMNEVQSFFNQYGEQEWNRLDQDVYSRINFLLHMDFIKENLFQGAKVLDAGCGAGRFSVEFAKMGCRVTLFDISDEQLRIAKNKIEENGLESQIDGYIQGDIRDLSKLDKDSFDLVICYGAPLSYVIDGRDIAVKELKRVTKENGVVAISVNNKWGILKTLLGNEYPDFFEKPDYWYITNVMNTGDLPRHEMVSHPPRHFFEACELKELLQNTGIRDLELAGSPTFSCGNMKQVIELAKDKVAYDTILEIELKTYRKATMVDNGEFLLIKGKK